MDTKITPELTPEAEAAVLQQFKALTNYGARKAFFEANPSLAKVYCASNFTAPVPVKAAPEAKPVAE